MKSITLSAEKLEQLAKIRRQIEELEAQFNQVAAGQIEVGPVVVGGPKKRNMTEAGRQAIAEAQKRRWAKQKKAAKA